jgi:hypothetical protein
MIGVIITDISSMGHERLMREIEIAQLIRRSSMVILVKDTRPEIEFKKLTDEAINLEMPLIELPNRKDHRTKKEHRAGAVAKRRALSSVLVIILL